MQHLTPFAIALLIVLSAVPACRREDSAPPKNLPPLPTEKALGLTKDGSGAPAAPTNEKKADVKPASVPAAALDPKRVEAPTGIAFDITEGWARQVPQSSTRIAELVPPRAPGETLDGILVVSYFAGGAGSLDANIARWASQVSDDKGSAKSGSDGKVRELALGSGAKVKIFEIEGMHTDTNMRTGESKKTPNARLVVATLDTDDGSYFFKLVAPVKTADTAMPGYEAMLKSVKLK